MSAKKESKKFARLQKKVYLCSRNWATEGRSPVGLERCSHIAEVPGSSPGVPTQAKNKMHFRRESEVHFFVELVRWGVEQ